MNKITKILISILLAVTILPTVAGATSLTLSILDGNTVEEAIVILAGQIDSLTLRVNKVEDAQDELLEQSEALQSNIEALRSKNEALEAQISAQASSTKHDLYCQTTSLYDPYDSYRSYKKERSRLLGEPHYDYTDQAKISYCKNLDSDDFMSKDSSKEDWEHHPEFIKCSNTLTLTRFKEWLEETESGYRQYVAECGEGVYEQIN